MHRLSALGLLSLLACQPAAVQDDTADPLVRRDGGYIGTTSFELSYTIDLALVLD